jgi:hypothetical protein
MLKPICRCEWQHYHRNNGNIPNNDLDDNHNDQYRLKRNKHQRRRNLVDLSRLLFRP